MKTIIALGLLSASAIFCQNPNDQVVPELVKPDFMSSSSSCVNPEVRRITREIFRYNGIENLTQEEISTVLAPNSAQDLLITLEEEVDKILGLHAYNPVFSPLDTIGKILDTLALQKNTVEDLSKAHQKIMNLMKSNALNIKAENKRKLDKIKQKILTSSLGYDNKKLLAHELEKFEPCHRTQKRTKNTKRTESLRQ
jgi:hypothetical protein